MSCASDYNYGDSAVIDLEFFDLTDAPADPTTLTVQLQRQRRRPSDAAPSITTYTFPNSHITHVSTGVYRVITDPIIVAGTYDVEAVATGALVTKTLYGRFTVKASIIE